MAKKSERGRPAEPEHRQLRVGDLIELPTVKTVIQLRDLEDDGLCRHLADSFVFTEDVTFALRTLMEHIQRQRGQGFFLIGHYGSGKSHLLLMLSVLLSRPDIRKELHVDDEVLSRLSGIVVGRKHLVLNIPLQEHSNVESLEQIVLHHLSRRLSSLGETVPRGVSPEALKLLVTTYRRLLDPWLQRQGATVGDIADGDKPWLAENFVVEHDLPIRLSYARHEFLPSLERVFARHGLDGAVIIIDELSEFLRSKLQPRSFHEDVRFLQFLGEGAMKLPLWVIASLQEHIEETGEIPHQTFQKIKDRYSVRFHLSGRHIAELVRRYLVRKKPGCEEVLSRIYDDLSRYFSELPFSRSSFQELYPVHPATIAVLDHLNPIFSQHRGVVDFIHYTLAGDEARRIVRHLDEPSDWLLCPDLIFDHFRSRIRETIEWNRYHDVVFRYFEDNVERLFSDDTERILALRIIRLLILTSLYPTPQPLSVTELSLMLLQRVTDFSPSLNEQYVRKVVEQLSSEGAYVVRRPDGQTGIDRYTIDVGHDVKVIVERKVDAIRREIFSDDPRYLTLFLEDLDESVLPLSRYILGEFYPLEVLWLNSRRSGYLCLTHGGGDHGAWLQGVREKLSQQDWQFLFILVSPLQPEGELKRLREQLLSILGQRADKLVLWVPKPFIGTPELQDMLARRLLMQRLKEEKTPQGAEQREYLKNHIEKDRPSVRETFRYCFTNGEIIGGDGEILCPVQSIGLLPFQDMMPRALNEFFRQRYPRHSRVAALTDTYPRNRLDDLIRYFFVPGRIASSAAMQVMVRGIIEGYLKPMSVIRYVRQEIELDCDPNRSEIVREALKLLERGPIERQAWETALSEGEYGLSEPQRELLLLSLLFSGNMNAASDSRTIDPATVSAKTLEKISCLAPGDIISPVHLDVLQSLQLLPESLIEKGFFGIIRQRETWQWLCHFKEETTTVIANSRARLEAIAREPLYSRLDTDKLRGMLAASNDFLEAIRITYDSRKGLLSVIDFIQSNPFVRRNIGLVQSLADFLANELPRWKSVFETARDFRNLRIMASSEQECAAIVPRFEDLDRELDREEVATDRVFREDLLRRWQEFVEAYRQAYRAGHTAYHSVEFLQPLEKIARSRQFRVLGRLTRLECIPASATSLELVERLETLRQSVCRQPVTDILQHGLVCNCGFEIGDRRELLDTEKILGDIEENISAAIVGLQGAVLRDILGRQLAELTECGLNRQADAIKQLFRIRHDDPELFTRLDELLTPDVISSVNTMLRGNLKIDTVVIDDFLEPVRGKILPVQRAIELFTEWLTVRQTEGRSGFVRIVGGEGPAATRMQASTPAGDTISPSLEALSRIADRRDIHLVIVMRAWLMTHKIPLEDMPHLVPTLPTTLLTAINDFANEADTVLAASPQMIEEVDRTLRYQGDTGQLIIHCLERGHSPDLVEFLRQETLLPSVFVAGIDLLISDIVKGQVDLTDSLLSRIGQSAMISRNRETRDCMEHLNLLKDLFTSRAPLMKHGGPPQSIPEWEQLFLDAIAHLPLHIARVLEMLNGRGLGELAAFLDHERIQSRLDRLAVEFESFYSADHEQKGEKLHDFLTKSRKKLLQHHPHARISILLVDGLRYDLWTILRSRFLDGADTKLRSISEHLIWANLPTTTARQLEPFLNGSQLSLLNIADDGNAMRASREEVAWSGGTILKINIIDNRIHTSRDPLPLLFEDMVYHCSRQIEPLIEDLSPQDILIVCSDHGFSPNSAFHEREKYKYPRYSHGGCSPHEVIVPAAVFMRLP